jgi:hypothetical protein
LPGGAGGATLGGEEAKEALMRVLAFTLAAAAALSAAPALAAPQPLALVATLGPVELNCDGRDCAAEFSAFCLQAERGSPDRGQAYRPLGAVRVAALDAQGREAAVPLELLEARALRTHVAVRLSVPEAALRARGLTSPRVTVGEDAALAPAPAAGDPRPLGPEELAAAAGPLRRLGASIVDADGAAMPAARILNRLVNALPPHEAERREGLWTRVAAPAAEGLPPEGVKRARAIYDLCRTAAETGVDPTLRRCLEARHDGLLGRLNGAYWRAVKAGS